MCHTMPENSTTSDRKPSDWDKADRLLVSIGARAEADLTKPGVVEAIFDAGREEARLTALESEDDELEFGSVNLLGAPSVLTVCVRIGDIYAAGRGYQRRTTASKAATA